tara:strand:- start:100 stop:552 length:453 start_codon:yes stop_codon:yes gene_type:complete
VQAVVDQDHRERMEALESAMAASDNSIDITTLECNHYFSHGLYTRELHIPQGVVITGAIHKYSNVNILSKGKVIAVTDQGRIEIEAPYTFVSNELVKKAIYAVEDAVWINVLPWDKEPDVDLVEQEYVIPTYDLLDIQMGLTPEKLLETG